MCNEKQLDFAIFMIYSLAEHWNRTPAQVYKLLNDSCIIDDYILPCYDVLHTLGRGYLVEDISELARERGVNI